MMDYPLLLRTFLLRAAKYFPKKEVVSIQSVSQGQAQGHLVEKRKARYSA